MGGARGRKIRIAETWQRLRTALNTRMPELAEVYYYARRWYQGRSRPVRAVATHEKSRVFRGCNVPALRRGLAGASLRRIHTHGKQMLFEFSGGRWLGIHLGMTGELSALAEPHAATRHDHLILRTGSLALVFNDPRQFGRVTFYEGKAPPAFWRARPPQPMEPAFTSERVASILQRHARQPLKALLLDQRYFPGVGNWMADEVLWQVKLPPHLAAGTLTARQSREIWRALRRICAGALRTVGNDWSDPPKSWLFSHRWSREGECPRCGAKLRHETVRGRTACWCPVCQRH